LNGLVRPPFRSLLGTGFFLALFLLVLPLPSIGQTPSALPAREVLDQVMPGIDRFSEKEGSPPVIRAWRTDPGTGEEVLAGYLFFTSDVPPEVKGYNNPIRVLVGMDLEGTLTGIRVISYQESLSSSRGNFLNARGFQEQFRGKGIRDPFRVSRDVESISGATITVDAMARGIREASRRVASTYLGSRAASAVSIRDAPLTVPEMNALSWMDLVDQGAVQRMLVARGDVVLMELFVTPLWQEGAGEVYLGPERFAEALERAGERAQTHHRLLIGVDGALIWFRPHLLTLVQGTDTISVSRDDLILFDPPRGGKVADQLGSAGIWLLDRKIDLDRPYTLYFGGSLGLDRFSMEMEGIRRPSLRAETPPAGLAPAPAPIGALESPTEGPAEGVDPREEGLPQASELPPETGAGSMPGSPTLSLSQDLPTEFDFTFDEEGVESQWDRTLARTDWGKVARLLFLLGLVSTAFWTGRSSLRWATLGATLLLLGIFDHGFLSVSHLTSAIAVGPGVFLNDVHLSLMVGFTGVTTLLWGRVFCGFLCPFGALQDLMDRLLPQKIRREFPPRLHRMALRLKYVFLAAILLPAILGSSAVIFHFFEPFGTVFFLSSSGLLWTLAGGIFVGAALIPRFYCRYACPLGAALAVASHLSPFRIQRVEQCSVCTVCERSCPTGAIQREKVDFPECVRCGVCESKLSSRAGSCRHSMEKIRPRLVQLTVEGAARRAPLE